MVSLGSSEEILLADAKIMLLQKLKDLSGKRNVDEAFTEWLLGRDDLPLRLQESVEEITGRQDNQMRYQDVAVLGYSAAAGSLEERIEKYFYTGINWLIGREPFYAGRLQAFGIDIVSLLGITLGVTASGDKALKEKYRSWLSKFIEKSFEARISDWKVCLLFSICQLSNINTSRALITDDRFADIRIALSSKGVLSYGTPSEEEDLVNALINIKRQGTCEIDEGHAALRLAALIFIQNLPLSASISKPSISDVAKALNRIPAAFRRWTWEDKPRTKTGTPRQWHIDNEYHVQNFLYFLLTPLFPDLKDEDYTSSVGPIHPRLDLAIPSLGLIVEVKFMRASDKPQKMIEQIATDASLYLVQGSGFQFILPFIWDDSCRTQEYDSMRNGLLQIDGIVEPVIIARPGIINR